MQMSTSQPTFLDCELNMNDIVMLIKVEALIYIVIEESNGNALFYICSLIFVVRVDHYTRYLREVCRRTRWQRQSQSLKRLGCVMSN